MDNPVNNTETPFTWEFRKNKSFLKNGDTIILALKPGKKKSAEFDWENKKYRIRNRGFWNPVTDVEEDGKKIASLRRTFRPGRTFIQFEEGNRYTCKAQNAVLVKFVVYSDDHKELIRYKLISKYKASMHLDFHQADIPQKELIILITLSCFVFRGILKENDFASLQSVVFSNAEKISAPTVIEFA